jgi:chaperonin GroEL
VSHSGLALQFGWRWEDGAVEFCDLMERGVINPPKVTISAIENSASVAGLVLTRKCLVIKIPMPMSKEDKQRLFDQWAMGTGMHP